MDPRVARTRQSLRAALFALARERPLDQISISDIAERAGVNRSTYYQHYSDKDTLLADALDAVIEEAVGVAGEGPITPEEGSQILADYLRHVEENASLYRVLVGQGGSAVAQFRMSGRLQEILSDAFAEQVPPGLTGVPQHVAAAAMAGSALATVRVWLETDPLPPWDVAYTWMWTVLMSPGLIPGATLPRRQPLTAPDASPAT